MTMTKECMLNYVLYCKVFGQQWGSSMTSGIWWAVCFGETGHTFSFYFFCRWKAFSVLGTHTHVHYVAGPAGKVKTSTLARFAREISLWSRKTSQRFWKRCELFGISLKHCWMFVDYLSYLWVDDRAWAAWTTIEGSIRSVRCFPRLVFIHV